MRFQETEVVELKAMVQDDIKKEIIAFTNCNGGTVYIGVADNGDILGVENADECALQISNMVRDAIKPDVTMFIHYETLNCDGREVVAIRLLYRPTWRLPCRSGVSGRHKSIHNGCAGKVVHRLA